MLTAEKQVSRVPGRSVTQARYSQPHLILFPWHPPAQCDIVTLNPSVFSNARQIAFRQDNCDISVPDCKYLLSLKVSVWWVLRSLSFFLSLSTLSLPYLPKRITVVSTFDRTAWQVATAILVKTSSCFIK